MALTKSQRDAVDHKDSDLIVSAAAGSGKTHTLVYRVIEHIMNGVQAEEGERNGLSKEKIAELRHGSDISRMLIVTFTNPAASELKSKICEEIGKKRAEFPHSPHLISQYTKSSYAEICTIDSFCIRLVRANFDKLPFSLDANFRIGDNCELNILDEQTMEELIDELYENSNKSDDFLLVADCYSKFRSESALSKALLDLRKKLLSTKDGIKTLLSNESYTGDFLSTPYGKVLIEHVLEITTHFIPIYKHFIELLAYDAIGADVFVPVMKMDLEQIEQIDACVKSKASYDALALAVNSCLLDYSFPSKPLKATDKSINISAFRRVRNSLKSTIDDLKKLFVANEAAVISSLNQNAKMCKAIYNILDLFENKLFEKKRRLSVYSFNDMSNIALSLLSGNNGLAEEVSKKYDDIYIDEYQDTNSVQDKIFAIISNKNRFMVGDIKQSIYRFRDAEPEIFKGYRAIYDTQDNFVKDKSLGKAIFMSENFRCDEPVINLSNLISDYMFENSYGIPYSKEDRLVFSKKYFDKENYKNRKSEIHIINSAGMGSNPIEYQAKYVAQQIKELIGQEMTLSKEDDIKKNGGKLTRKIKPEDITILLRNANKQIPFYVQALKNEGVCSVYKATENLFDTPHIMLVLCILNAIDNPSKDIYLAGAMRSPVFNFSLEELVKIKKQVKGEASLYATLKSFDGDTKLKEKIQSFVELLEKYKKDTKRMHSHDALSYVYNKCGLFSMCNENERQDLLKLYNIARVFEGSSFKGLFVFLNHVEQLAQNYDAREFKGDLTKSSVKLMSIHASKGLQFPICFICETQNAMKGSNDDELLFHRDLGVAGYVGQNDGLARFNTLARKCIALKTKKDSIEEEMRILYVALTRAEKQLIITGTASEPKEKRRNATELASFTTPFSLYNTNSLMGFILGALKDDSTNDYSLFVNTNAKDSVPPPSASDPSVVDYIKLFSERFDYDYEYKYLERIPSKISVSSLCSNILDVKNSEIKIPELDSKPKFMLSEEDKENSITGAQKGTATHVFLQFCSFDRLLANGFENELEQLVRDKFISEGDSTLVDKDSIEKFMKSKLLNEQILKARSVHREFRFNLLLDANDFTSKKDLPNEKILVQGVMDCILELDDGRLVLIDYKTDKVTPDNYKDELKDRYENQLKYYKLACEKIFGKKVFEVKLYSVPVGDDFALDIK